MSSSNCCFLTCVQVSQEADQVVWYSHLFQNFPQFIVIHTFKGFGIVNKAEIDIFLEISCLFDDPVELAIWSLVPLPFLKPAWLALLFFKKSCIQFYKFKGFDEVFLKSHKTIMNFLLEYYNHFASLCGNLYGLSCSMGSLCCCCFCSVAKLCPTLCGLPIPRVYKDACAVYFHLVCQANGKWLLVLPDPSPKSPKESFLSLSDSIIFFLNYIFWHNSQAPVRVF